MSMTTVKKFYTIPPQCMGRFLILALFFGATLNAHAGSSYCLEYRNLSAVIYDNHEGSKSYPDYSCDDFMPFDDLTGSVLSLAPHPVDSLVVWGQKAIPVVGSYQSTISQITLGLDKSNPQNVSANSVIYAHELGHAMFDSILAEKIPLVGKMNSLRRLNDQRLIQFGIPIGQISADCVPSTAACREKIDAIFEKIPAHLKDAEQNLSDFKIQYADEWSLIQKISSPYHELFADVVTSLYFEDPDSNSRAISLFVKTEESCRSFSKVLATDFKSNDPHCSLSSIRRQLWTQLITPNIQNKRKVLQHIGEVFAEEVSIQLKNKQDPDYLNSTPLLMRLSRALGMK